MGGSRGGGCLDPSPAPAPHLYITHHLTSLTSFKTMFNIVYELASFKTMFNIVYELDSFKTIICSRVGVVVGVGRGRGGWG